jgi:Demerecviridae HNH endonuclease
MAIYPIKFTGGVQIMLAQERLRELIYYDPETGYFTWRVNRGRLAKARERVGWIDKGTGYRRMKVEGGCYKASRLAFLYMEGYFPEGYIDHSNRVRTDDRWKNLRHVSPTCNNRNIKVAKNNTSSVKGVHWNKLERKWCAQITVAKKLNFLGFHKDLTEAVAHRFAAEQCLDWLDCDMNSSAGAYLKAHLS